MMERYAEITGKNPRDLNLITFILARDVPLARFEVAARSIRRWG